MKNQKGRMIFGILFLTLLVSFLPGLAQSADDLRRPIDMMVVLDNSCSMFPVGVAPEDVCYSPPGNDAGNLRIHGTNLFLSALGQGETNESEYQVGIIEFGDTARVIAPLQPLTDTTRGNWARIIAAPAPIPYTDMAEALTLAYETLRTSPNRRPTNLPAVVLITDGIPDKSDFSGVDPLSDSRTEIGQIVENNPDIPLFIMLLKGNEGGDYITLYDEYINFWQDIRNENDQIFVYLIEDAAQIDETYNEIISQLQNTASTPGLPVAPGEPLKVFVGQYVQRLVIKIDHGADLSLPRGNVLITDPKGNAISDSDIGVDHYNDPANPWETIVVSSERLDWDSNGDGVFDLKDDFWQIESDKPVSVFIDLRDAYRFNFLEPEVTLVDVGVPNVYLALNRQSPVKSLIIRFNLLDKNNNIIFDPQPLTGKVLHPDGSESELRIPSDIVPDGSGTYQILYDYASTYTGSLEGINRFTFVLEAGASEIRGGSTESPLVTYSPIATSRLFVDVGRGAYIDQVTPITCATGQVTEIEVNIGDYEYSDPTTMRVRLFDGSQEILLGEIATGTFSADVTDLCVPLLASLTCSTGADASWIVSLVAQTLEGYPVQSQQNVVAQIQAPPCTATPTPSPTATLVPTPTPTPTPTPIPDSDQDGGNDLVDQCVNVPGIAGLDWCPIPWWVWVVLALLALSFGAFLVFYLIPFINVRMNKPPKASLEVKRGGKLEPSRNLQQAGIDKRKREITIGSDKKAVVQVAGLKPFEYVVTRESTGRVRVYKTDDKGKAIGTGGRNVSSEQKEEFTTSNDDVVLIVSVAEQKTGSSGAPRPTRPTKPTGRN
ncbi:MAG: VWA domain-containing protein [Chloroflexi bacterium]|nr:VWA domain-containing protein [Chloroflexota bacterium]MBP8054581.1 VWA domain-containing protein [Chloroflexota bacterium]